MTTGPARIWWVHELCDAGPTAGVLGHWPPASCAGCGRADGAWWPGAPIVAPTDAPGPDNDACGKCGARLAQCVHCASLAQCGELTCVEHDAEMAPRRVRTQAERDADGVAWRQTADTRPGYATWPQTAPGNPSWWRHDLLAVRTADGRMHAPADVAFVYPDVPPADGETCAKWCGYCHLNNGEPAPLAEATDAVVDDLDDALADGRLALTELLAPLRRRWWHRLTRRAL